MGEEVELSNWGQLVWERCKSKFYSEKILQPLGHISYSKSGKISLNNLDKSFLQITTNDWMICFYTLNLIKQTALKDWITNNLKRIPAHLQLMNVIYLLIKVHGGFLAMKKATLL